MVEDEKKGLRKGNKEGKERKGEKEGVVEDEKRGLREGNKE